MPDPTVHLDKWTQNVYQGNPKRRSQETAKELRKEKIIMKWLKLLGIASVAVGLFCFNFALAADAPVDQGNGLTLPQVLTGILVMGWYLYNHFKKQIKALSRHFFSKNKGPEKL